MTRPPRGLSADEAVLWGHLAATVTPLHKAPPPLAKATISSAGGGAKPAIVKPAPTEPPKRVKGRIPPPRPAPAPAKPAPAPGLDSHWERRLARTSTSPDFTLDLHGCTLDQAHTRLDAGLFQAREMGARLVLVITGKSRPVDAADRGDKRGAIRAKILDWLAAGSHANAIAAVRPAHRRHGGEGAIYLVLRR
jgi:DNA-nicking Smr family endonuclease